MPSRKKIATRDFPRVVERLTRIVIFVLSDLPERSAGRNGVAEERVHRLVLEYAQAVDTRLPLNPELSLREDLGVESLSLVSLIVRLGDEFGADVAERGVDLGRLRTVGDLVALSRVLENEPLG